MYIKAQVIASIAHVFRPSMVILMTLSLVVPICARGMLMSETAIWEISYIFLPMASLTL